MTSRSLEELCHSNGASLDWHDFSRTVEVMPICHHARIHNSHECRCWKDLKKITSTISNTSFCYLPFYYFFRVSVDASLLSNIQKLFSERIEIFTSVEFTKVSVLTGIIKIALKVRFLIAGRSFQTSLCFYKFYGCPYDLAVILSKFVSRSNEFFKS